MPSNQDVSLGSPPVQDPDNWGKYHGDSSTQTRVWIKRLEWRITTVGGAFFKRALDIAVTLLASVVAVPVVLVVAVLIKLTEGGPIFFWQKRVGRYGQVFDFPKIRSMRIDAEAVRSTLTGMNRHGNSITFKMKNDPRITRIGRFIRKYSIDELPQLWCVLKGDMSLVGPRPPLPGEVECYNLSGRRRLDIRPGLTCLWQVQGRADIPFERQVQLDVEYIENRSFWLDLVILAKTIPAVLFGKGAY
jgi:lipopolysaccharide/colanic/teichoic acid biosynthesis glycosyltransferase